MNALLKKEVRLSALLLTYLFIGFDHIGLQLLTLLAGVILYILLTVMSYNKACESFERIDL